MPPALLYSKDIPTVNMLHVAVCFFAVKAQRHRGNLSIPRITGQGKCKSWTVAGYRIVVFIRLVRRSCDTEARQTPQTQDGQGRWPEINDTKPGRQRTLNPRFNKTFYHEKNKPELRPTDTSSTDTFVLLRKLGIEIPRLGPHPLENFDVEVVDHFNCRGNETRS